MTSLNVRALLGALLVIIIGVMFLFYPGLVVGLTTRRLLVVGLTFCGLVFHLFNTYEARPPRIR